MKWLLMLGLIGTTSLVFAQKVSRSKKTKSYEATIQQWREKHEAEMKSEEGYLTLTGLYRLQEGDNSIGVTSSSRVILPQGTAPDSIGMFRAEKDKLTLIVNDGVPVKVNGTPVQTAEIHSNNPKEKITLNDLFFSVAYYQNRWIIGVWDKNYYLRKEFKGMHWFPIKSEFRVKAKYVPYNPAKVMPITNIKGETNPTEIAGYVVFTLRGQEYKLDVQLEEETKLFINFRDLTYRQSTYQAGRFLDAELGKARTVILDFNKAVNPPCAFSPFTTCPTPPAQNRLQVAIEAGEMRYLKEGK